ncbi:MAG TPA: single-stranded DNA-binding protein [Terrimesophilobacter sp.]|uniref:single-stranded DNA-binding protein n=1 Tax=Terrimesophilobacter sp. TaxID=2906435 RepID=UPI002F92B252
MTDTLTLTGLVATTPRHLITAEGLPITSFRLASNQRRFDRPTGTWVDAGTNWYTVSAFRGLAVNVVGSIQKGDRVVVVGRLHVRDWESGEKRGRSVELDATAIGHDLSWGKSSFTRSIQSAAVEEASFGAASGDEAEDEAPTDAETVGAEFEELPVPF